MFSTILYSEGGFVYSPVRLMYLSIDRII